MVSNVSCKCWLLWHKAKKEKNSKTRDIWIPSFQIVCKLLLCCPTTVFLAVVKRTGSIIQCFIVVLLLFKPEDKIELLGEFKLKWSALRRFNWQYPMSCIMPQSTDLFCHTILFGKFNMLNGREDGEQLFLDKFIGVLFYMGD